MRIPQTLTVLGLFIAKSGCSVFLQHRYLDRRMDNDFPQACLPNYNASTAFSDSEVAALIDSPYPCEVAGAMDVICSANGTTPLDLLAEQECFCNGSYFDVTRGCSACYVAQGLRGPAPSDAAQYFSTLSALECDASPTDRFGYAVISFVLTANTYSLTTDEYPTNTAVSDYWTATGPVTLGAITGSATARDTTATWNVGSDSTLIDTPGTSTSSASASSNAKPSPSPSPPTKNSGGSKSGAAIDAMGVCVVLLTALITFVVLL